MSGGVECAHADGGIKEMNEMWKELWVVGAVSLWSALLYALLKTNSAFRFMALANCSRFLPRFGPKLPSDAR